MGPGRSVKELAGFFSQSHQIERPKGQCLPTLWATKDLQTPREGTTREATTAGQHLPTHVAHRGQTCDSSARRLACLADGHAMPAGEAHGQDQQKPGPTQDHFDPVGERKQRKHVVHFRGQTCETGEPAKTPGVISNRRPACIAAGHGLLNGAD